MVSCWSVNNFYFLYLAGKPQTDHEEEVDYVDDDTGLSCMCCYRTTEIYTFECGHLCCLNCINTMLQSESLRCPTTKKLICPNTTSEDVKCATERNRGLLTVSTLLVSAMKHVWCARNNPLHL